LESEPAAFSVSWHYNLQKDKEYLTNSKISNIRTNNQ
jgi:hypothetical protein